VLADSDVLSLHLLLTDETKGFVSRAHRDDEAGRHPSEHGRAARWSTRRP
jgi:hypothetical protein